MVVSPTSKQKPLNKHKHKQKSPSPNCKTNTSPITTEAAPPTQTQSSNPLSTKQTSLSNRWRIYYDPHYKQNFYYNPITAESVWELPANAVIEPTSSPLEIQQPDDAVPANDDNAASPERDPALPKRSYQELESVSQPYLTQKLLYEQHKSNQLSEWMKRPARQQVTDTRKDTAYIEGNYDYNIWYDKYLTDRKEEKEKIPALHKCNPSLDTGFTRADKQAKEGSAFFCLYFAKGCCSEGVNCHYYHRVPTISECKKIENLRDIFGRSRFDVALKDNGGIGVFTKECRTLLVSDLKKIETKNPIRDMVKLIYSNFSPWGEIEDINYIPMKSLCYIRYAHRCFAEYAKEAMMKQSLVSEEIITIKWAYDEPNPVNAKVLEREEENMFLAAYYNKK